MFRRYLACTALLPAISFVSFKPASAQVVSAQQLQSRLDSHCAALGAEGLNTDEKLARVEAFYSWKLNTCVQLEVDDNEWSYILRDVTHEFLRGPKLTTDEIPLSVSHDEKYGWASTEGFWKATETSKDKQLVAPIVAKIVCTRDERICKESDATLFISLLQPDSHEYSISSWTRDGIVADDNDEGECAIGHRLSIDFNTKSVVVTDYPKKLGGDASCKAFQTANSYALHGGSVAYISLDGIFSCTKDGVNNAVTEKVIGYHGDVVDKTYGLWMDDGKGGPPATLKIPPHPYTKSDCERAVEKKLAELKAQ
jgi:hypothetical protein